MVVGRGGACGGWNRMGERKLMEAEEYGEKSRIETRLDFGGLLRSFFCDYVQPKRPFASRSLTILIRPNPAKRKMELWGANRGSKTRAAVSPYSTGFTTFDRLRHFRPSSSVSTGFTTTTATSENGSPSRPTFALAHVK